MKPRCFIMKGREPVLNAETVSAESRLTSETVKQKHVGVTWITLDVLGCVHQPVSVRL